MAAQNKPTEPAAVAVVLKRSTVQSGVIHLKMAIWAETCGVCIYLQKKEEEEKKTARRLQNYTKREISTVQRNSAI
jgi:hypothetical protein